MRKSALIILIAIALSARIFAQEPKAGAGNDSPKAYGEIAIDSSLIKGELSRWYDFRAGLTFGDRVKAGLGIAVPAKLEEVYYAGQSRKLEGSHGGIDIGVKALECGRVSIWADGLFGGGAFAYGGTNDASAPYLSAELRCVARLTIAPFLKASAGAGYRGISLLSREDAVQNGHVSGLIWCFAGTVELETGRRKATD